MSENVSVAQQLEAVDFACHRQASIAQGQTIKPGPSRSREEFDLKRLQAARKSMEWFQRHELDIRELMALPPQIRRALLAAATAAAPHALRIAALDAPAVADLRRAVDRLVQTARLEP